MAALNYAAQYAQALANAYPYVLNFGDLYATENNGRYRMGEDGKTVYVPSITTTGRVDATRDSIGTAARNYDNAWEPKALSHQRKWSTLVHPKDIDQTNYVTTIANITQTFNETEKFPEMDAYTISTLYSLWVAQSQTADTTVPSASNVLTIFDTLMTAMSEARTPANGRILYCTNAVYAMLKASGALTRMFDVKDEGARVSREIYMLDGVKVIAVPSDLMKTAYTFTTGWAVDTTNAKQIHMFLVHPSAVITPVSYQFASLDPPSAITEGKYYYYEESFEDVFILNKRVGGLQFCKAS